MMAQQHQEQDDERFISASQAAAELRMSRAKIAELLRNGTLPYQHDPLDGRLKLIPLSVVERLKRVREERRALGDSKAMQVA